MAAVEGVARYISFHPDGLQAGPVGQVGFKSGMEMICTFFCSLAVHLSVSYMKGIVLYLPIPFLLISFTLHDISSSIHTAENRLVFFFLRIAESILDSIVYIDHTFLIYLSVVDTATLEDTFGSFFWGGGEWHT